MIVRGNQVGDTIEYTCEAGYHLIGDNLRTCLADGQWSGSDPACDPVICPVPKNPEHGTWNVGGFVPGSAIRFECHQGYTLVGSATITCLMNKEWSDDPPLCQQITCPPLRDPEYGTVHVTLWTSDNVQLANHITQQNFYYRSTAQYQCKEGYQLFGPEKRTCTNQGVWSERGPQCKRVWCPEPQPPVQGFVMGTGRQFGDKVRYACSAGYRLIGTDEATCQATGTWSTSMPLCQALTCDAPPFVAHSVVPHAASWPTGAQLLLRCQDGYSHVGDLSVKCLANQQWSPIQGHCQKIHCPRPAIKGASSVVPIGNTANVKGQYHNGDRVVVFCQPGRRNRGSATLTCQSDGQWSGQLPVCDSHCDIPCMNGGSCHASRKCSCPQGYSGDRCQHAHCILPCLHGGTCVAPYRCACRPGYTGLRCEKPLCDVACLNGGRCIAPNTCHCPSGTVGSNCRKRSDFFSPRG
nr:EOG090X05QS [Polyphemus pediculus]